MSLRGNNVRLTESAHVLLTEKADALGVSMKEIASEAIPLMFSKEKAQEDCKEVIEDALRAAHADVFRLENKIRENKLFAFGTFILGALTGGCLVCVYFLGMV